MARLIIASAAVFETRDLVNKLGFEGLAVTQLVVGIGLTESAITSGRLRELVTGRDVVFCCTGGLIGDFSEVAVYQAQSAIFAPPDIRFGDSYLVANADPTITMQGLPLSIKECTVNGSSSISLRREKKHDAWPSIETLELYAVARAWLPLAKTFTAVVATTNEVGPLAHEQWKANYRLAANKTADIIAGELLKLKSRWS